MLVQSNFIEYSLAKDFSPCPGGRHREDGEYSADCLKEQLYALLNTYPHKTILLNLDDYYHENGKLSSNLSAFGVN